MGALASPHHLQDVLVDLEEQVRVLLRNFPPFILHLRGHLKWAIAMFHSWGLSCFWSASDFVAYLKAVGDVVARVVLESLVWVQVVRPLLSRQLLAGAYLVL